MSDLEQVMQNDPQNLPKRFTLSAKLLMEDQIESTMVQLIGMLKLEWWYAGELARHGPVAEFNMLGDDHEQVKKFRLRLFILQGSQG